MHYLHSAKPRIVVLFLLLTSAALVVARGEVPLGLLARTLLGVGLAVGGAGALNNYLERDRDGLMHRTKGRALPAGKLAPGRVLFLGAGLLLAGLLELWWQVGAAPALLAAAGASYYALVYTLVLKPRSAYGVVPGGLAGIFPPLVGWSASGEPPSLILLLVCGLIFLWSPPHFWALALARVEDYRNAGFPTLVGRAGEAATRLHITVYLAALLCLSLLPAGAGLLGLPYLVGALLAAVILGLATINLHRQPAGGAAWLLYKLSGPYLALVLAAMVVDRLATTTPVIALREGITP